MNEEFKKAIVDYFTPGELFDLLDLSDRDFEQILDCIEDTLIDNSEDIKEYMNYGNVER